MTEKRKKKNEEEALLDLHDYGIKEDELKDIISMNEKGNLHVLRHRIKKINASLETIEDSLFLILFKANRIINNHEEGKGLMEEDRKTVEKMLLLSSFTEGMSVEFSKMKLFIEKNIVSLVEQETKNDEEEVTIDSLLEKIEDSLFDILFEIDELIEDYQEGKIFTRDSTDAIEGLFMLSEFTKGMEREFEKMRNIEEA